MLCIKVFSCVCRVPAAPPGRWWVLRSSENQVTVTQELRKELRCQSLRLNLQASDIIVEECASEGLPCFQSFEFWYAIGMHLCIRCLRSF